MTFTDFKSFINWCKDVNEISVRKVSIEENTIEIEELANTDSLIVAELLITAYDSGFYLGPFDSTRCGGCIVIHE